MKLRSFALASAAILLGAAFASAQDTAKPYDPQTTRDAIVPEAAVTGYTFTEVNYPGDQFTQLLGINNKGVIAGYHGSGLTATHPNKGFTLTLTPATTFTAENYPNSVQTQVIGINDLGNTDGFYIDTKGVTHGFLEFAGKFGTITFPASSFNQLLGLNNNNVMSGYWQDNDGNFHAYVHGASAVFASYDLSQQTGAVSTQATGTNILGDLVGFYINGQGVTAGFIYMNGTLHSLVYPGAISTQALGINDSDTVVGTYTDVNNNTHGFVWKNGFFTSIDDPSGGAGTTLVNGINNAGTIVGFWGNNAAGISHGFVAVPK